MAIYTVLAPPVRVGDAAEDPLRTIFVKDGFAWPALFFAVIWMIYRRLWLVLLFYLVVVGSAAFALSRTGGDFAGPVLVLLSILFALEANNLRRWTLERRGFRLAAVAEGRTMEEAEIRYFAALESGAAVMTAPPAPPAPRPPMSVPTPPAPPAAETPPSLRPLQPSAEAGDVVGLFPAPAAPRGGSS